MSRGGCDGHTVRMDRGLFVVLEGGEGAGKSTLQRALAERLQAAGHTVTVSREPGGTAVGERVRDLLALPLAPWAEAFAFFTARAQIVAEVILPALERGEVVICDRFSASTFAYQGYGRGLALDLLRAANTAATGGLEPDLTLFLDVPVAMGLARQAREGDSLRTGAEALAFHERVREGYLALLAADEAWSQRWLRIDASRPAGLVGEEAWHAVLRALDEGGS
jgi:dTMP kinase